LAGEPAVAITRFEVLCPEIAFYSPAEIYQIQMPAKNRKPVIFVDNRNH
jgi:hypothetical protein